MVFSRNIPSDVVFDALNLNKRKSAHDSFMRVPSLAVFKPPALIFITDAKEPNDGNRQKRSSKYARIREFVRRPKEQSRKTPQARIRNKLQKGIRGVIKGVGMSKGEGPRRRSGYAENASGAGSGSGPNTRTSAAVADATPTTRMTTNTPATTTGRSTSTFSAEKSKANTAATTVLYLP